MKIDPLTLAIVRGSQGAEVVTGFLRDEGTMSFIGDRAKFAPKGLGGGTPGQKLSIEIWRNGAPKRRPVPAVVDDVCNEYITRDIVRGIYGVALRPGSFDVGEAETAKLREDR